MPRSLSVDRYLKYGTKIQKKLDSGHGALAQWAEPRLLEIVSIEQIVSVDEVRGQSPRTDVNENGEAHDLITEGAGPKVLVSRIPSPATSHYHKDILCLTSLIYFFTLCSRCQAQAAKWSSWSSERRQPSDHRRDAEVHPRFRPAREDDVVRAGTLQEDAGTLSKPGQSGVGAVDFSPRSQAIAWRRVPGFTTARQAYDPSMATISSSFAFPLSLLVPRERTT